jgi:molecular chaperone GrpE (heat shock protein)
MSAPRPLPEKLPPQLTDVARGLQTVVSEYCSFLEGFAELLDGIDRCRAEAPPAEAARWDLLRRQAQSLLFQHGVRPTAQVGQPVDLERHEVLSAEPRDGAAPDTIVHVAQVGLELSLLGQTLKVRPARVVIAAAAPAPEGKN